MNAKVLVRFRDKNTKEIKEPGTIITVTKERFEEINSKHEYLEEVKSDKE